MTGVQTCALPISAIQNVGHVFAAVRTDLFVSDAEFRSRMDAILVMLKSAPPAAGCERVLVPGEIELAHERRHREQGIPLAPAIEAQLVDLGGSVGVAFPAPLAASANPESARA